MVLIFGFGIWFWTLVIIEFIILSIFVEQEFLGLSWLTMAIFIVLLWCLADIPIWDWIKNNPKKLLLYCVYYIPLGLVWTIIKYYFELNNLRNELKIFKEQWKKLPPQNEYPTFNSYLKNNHYYKMSENTPDSEGNISKLTLWASFWPISFVWTILNDPVKKLFKWLIKDVFGGIFRKMYNRMIGSVIDG